MTIAVVSGRARIVIPKCFREKYRLEPGTPVKVMGYGGGILIFPPPVDPIKVLRGMFASESSLTDDLHVERQCSRIIE